MTQPGPWKTTDYDPETGLKALLTDAVGNITSYEYEGYRLKRQTETPAGSEGPEKNYLFEYYDDGQLMEVKTSSGTGSAGDLRVESRQYDPETGRLSKLTVPRRRARYARHRLHPRPHGPARVDVLLRPHGFV